jgi:hypothetical protein
MKDGELYYRRYGDNIIIIFDQNKISKELIYNYMNNVHQCLKSKLTEEENNNITYLDLYINRNNNNLHVGIHRKLTQAHTTIHFISNHPLEHKRAAYSFCINRKIALAIRE